MEQRFKWKVDWGPKLRIEEAWSVLWCSPSANMAARGLLPGSEGHCGPAFTCNINHVTPQPFTANRQRKGKQSLVRWCQWPPTCTCLCTHAHARTYTDAQIYPVYPTLPFQKHLTCIILFPQLNAEPEKMYCISQEVWWPGAQRPWGHLMEPDEAHFLWWRQEQQEAEW